MSIRRRDTDDDLIRSGVELGRNLPLPNIVSIPLDAASDYYRSNDEAEERTDAEIYDKELSPAAKRVLERSNTSKLPKYVLQAASGTGGGIIGAMIGSAILPIGGTMIGGLVGSMGAGYASGRLYEGNFESPYEQNYVNHIARCYCKLHDAQESITEDEAALILMGKLSLKRQEKIANDLERLTGISNVAEALEDPKSKPAAIARRIFRDNQSTLRSYSGINFDPDDMEKPVEAQLAEFANNGVDIRLLAKNRHAFNDAVDRYYKQRAIQANGNGMPQDANQVVAQQQLPAPPRTSDRALT